MVPVVFPGQFERRYSLFQRKKTASCRYALGFQPTVSSLIQWSMGEVDSDNQVNTFDPRIAEAHIGFLHHLFSRNRADAKFPPTLACCRSAGESKATDAQLFSNASTLCHFTS